MTLSKSNRIALITGGSRGLGKSMTLALAARGVDSVITYRVGEREAQLVASEVSKLGRTCLPMQLDVADATRFGAFADALDAALRAAFSRDTIDYLINNAGHGVHASFAATTVADFDALMNVHLKGPFFLTQQLLPLIADGGRVLNVSSGLARFSMPGYAAYATMKGGVEVLTRYMAKELGARRISVNTIAPGAIETDFGGGLVRDNAQINSAIAGQTALGRVGLPDDIGQAVAMLLAPESHWITGQRIEASGGMSL